jgi:hypothetical protein
MHLTSVLPSVTENWFRTRQLVQNGRELLKKVEAFSASKLCPVVEPVCDERGKQASLLT